MDVYLSIVSIQFEDERVSQERSIFRKVLRGEGGLHACTWWGGGARVEGNKKFHGHFKERTLCQDQMGIVDFPSACLRVQSKLLVSLSSSREASCLCPAALKHTQGRPLGFWLVGWLREGDRTGMKTPVPRPHKPDSGFALCLDLHSLYSRHRSE